MVFYNNMGWVHIFLMKKADASFTESDERKELSLEIPNRMIFLQKFQISLESLGTSLIWVMSTK